MFRAGSSVINADQPPRLKSIKLGNNRLADFDQLRRLASLAGLAHVSLEGNPLSSSTDYRPQVLHQLVQLQTLDGL
jgi:hypothetical protein